MAQSETLEIAKVLSVRALLGDLIALPVIRIIEFLAKLDSPQA
jgi:hypothetical protein